EVAIKVLNTGFATDAERRTFERECHALGRLSHHPNIVTVFDDAITDDGRPCIVMELYSSTYRERVEEIGPLPIDEVLAVAVRICGALQTAHEAGVLHRDIKPHNIFLSPYGDPALGDFGISTIDDERSHSGASGVSVAYAAPEVLEDSRASPAADVYSLAATIYQLIAGASPYASADMKTTVRRILTEEPPPLGRAGAPPGLDRVLRRALAKDPASRQESAVEFAEMIREVQARAGFDRTPIPRLTGGVDVGAPVDVETAQREPTRAPAGRPVVAGPSVVPPSIGEDSADSGVTIARARPVGSRAPRSDADAPPGPDARRRWIAIGSMAAAALVITAGVLALGDGDDDETSPSSTALGPTPTDPFLAILQPPSDITVVALGDGTFEVSYVAPEGAASVQIEYAGGDSDRIVSSDASPEVLDGAGPTLCVTLRSVGSAGRISDDTDPVCSG
ncbi:MAG TPA: protein kinase, partial [Ilumatobacteraceae bacterium]|nr:protein kinase [Ilumatobacteraceae bacterium]